MIATASSRQQPLLQPPAVCIPAEPLLAHPGQAAPEASQQLTNSALVRSDLSNNALAGMIPEVYGTLSKLEAL